MRDFRVYLAFLGVLGCSPERAARTQVAERSSALVASAAPIAPATLVGDNHFGSSVSMSGNALALVGAPLRNGQQGAAIVFTRTGGFWDTGVELSDGDPVPNEFGQAVAIDADKAVVGTKANKAFIVTRAGTDWTNPTLAELNTDAPPLDSLGTSVALSGDTVLVGAPVKSGSGAVYFFVFDGNSWVQQQKVDSPGAQGDAFGNAVALAGDVALVAAYRDSSGLTSYAGRAYVLTRSGTSWSAPAPLPIDPPDNSGFGNSVALSASGDTALVGAPGNIGLPPKPGTAYVFRQNGGAWVKEQNLVPSEGGDADGYGFGTSVALSANGNIAVVGAPASDMLLGGAYVFVRVLDHWTQVAKLSDNALAGDSFAEAVSFSNRSALVGSPQHPGGQGPGAAYVFLVGNPQCPPADCAPNACVSGFCCDTPCTGACATCSRAGGAPLDGVCAPALAGTHVDACGKYVCTGASLSCPTSCSSDADCYNAFCSEGVCCDQPCDGTCESCLGDKTGQTTGVCSPIPKGTDPDSECLDQGSSCKGLDGLCNGERACDTYPDAGCKPNFCDSGAECTSGSCVDGTCCSSPVVGDAGKCCDVSTCGGYQCLPNGTCRTSCVNVTDCVSPKVCDFAGHCVDLPASSPESDSACGCRSVGRRVHTGWSALSALLLALHFRRRRRAR